MKNKPLTANQTSTAITTSIEKTDASLKELSSPSVCGYALLPADLSKKNKAVFFDRDGTLNVDTAYLHEIKDFRWIKGAIDAIIHAKKLGYLVIVVTNQSGIARGYYGEESVKQIHDYMNSELTGYGVNIDALYYCPHHTDGIIPRYRKKCTCRKPEAGMLMQAIADYNIDAGKSILIGDNDSDIKAAQIANIKGIKYEGGSLLECMKVNWNNWK